MCNTSNIILLIMPINTHSYVLRLMKVFAICLGIFHVADVMAGAHRNCNDSYKKSVKVCRSNPKCVAIASKAYRSCQKSQRVHNMPLRQLLSSNRRNR